MDSNFAEPYYYEGLLYSKQNQIEYAFKNYNKAIELKNDFDIAYHDRGILQLSLQKYNEAFLDFNKAIKLNPPRHGSCLHEPH